MIFRRRLFKHIFNHKDWIKRPEERKHMVAYIERKKLLIGLTKEEVILKLSVKKLYFFVRKTIYLETYIQSVLNEANLYKAQLFVFPFYCDEYFFSGNTSHLLGLSF
jgi:hypothetical protein